MIVVIYVVVKKFLSNDGMSESLTKKLMNYMSNDPKNSFKMSNYDTIGNDKKNEGGNNQNNDCKLNLDNHDSLSNFVEKETSERNNKLVRFGEDYCRASPNINLKQKVLLNIGWRTAKFNYEVEFGLVNFKGEKTNVSTNSYKNIITLNDYYVFIILF